MRIALVQMKMFNSLEENLNTALFAMEHIPYSSYFAELKATGEKIIGPGGVKMSQPTLWAILLIFRVGIGVKVLSIK